MGQEGLRKYACRRETDRGMGAGGVGEAVREIGDVTGARTDRRASCTNGVTLRIADTFNVVYESLQRRQNTFNSLPSYKA